jgi:hypothetical protein
MDNDSHTPRQDKRREEDRGGILQRIEEKLDRLLGREDDWHEREWAPPGDPRPRFFEGPLAEGWDSSFAEPRFDRIDVGSVGSDGVDPVSSFDPEQGPFFGARSSAREYYLATRARAQRDGGAIPYADYRRRKRAELDREYADYCRDRQACFDRDFDAWRQKRAGPAPSVDEPARRETAAKNAEDR